jgi:hypothetical protein
MKVVKIENIENMQFLSTDNWYDVNYYQKAFINRYFTLKILRIPYLKWAIPKTCDIQKIIIQAISQWIGILTPLAVKAVICIEILITNIDKNWYMMCIRNNKLKPIPVISLG